jgi:hypothetical protein
MEGGCSLQESKQVVKHEVVQSTGKGKEEEVGDVFACT